MLYMKRCPSCGVVKPRDEWPANRTTGDGLGAECKACKNERRRSRSLEQKRAERLAWRSANRDKWLAQKALQKAVVRGSLVRPSECDDCGSAGLIHAHHPDYTRRFDVEWLCPSCHGMRHRLDADAA